MITRIADRTALAANTEYACPLVVHCAFDRIRHLLTHANSVFLRTNVFPLIRCDIANDTTAADTFAQEMSGAMSALNTIDDIAAALIVYSDAPHKNIGAAIEYFMQHRRQLRCLIITRQRPLQQIIDAHQTADAVADGSADVYQLIRAVAEAHPNIRADDFFPLSALTAVAPILQRFGIISAPLTLNTHPLCSLICPLVYDTRIGTDGVPLMRIFNVRAFHQLLTKINKLAASDTSTPISIANANRLHRAVTRCIRDKRITFPNVLSFAASKTQTEYVTAAARATQVLLIHNLMDVAAVDTVRRCRCAVIAQSPLNTRQHVADCLQCL